MTGVYPAFDFKLPTNIRWGEGSAREVGQEVLKLGATSVVIVTDPGIRRAGLLDPVMSSLSDAGVQCTVFEGVEPNPKDQNVRDGAVLVREIGGALVAIGGGSPIDCAKGISALVGNGGEDIRRYAGRTAINRPGLPWIAVPTTAGTGSEVTFSSVITDTDRKFKFTVKSPLIAAKVALVDPLMTVTMPPQVTASTGVDALTHAIEAYTVKCAEPVSDALALHAIELISSSLRRAWSDGQDLEARSSMLMGSLLAGLAFSHSDVGSVHCLAEAMGGLYDAPHGVCNAVLLPYVMEYNMDYCQERYARVAAAMGACVEQTSEGARIAVQMVRQLVQDVRLPSLSDIGIKTGDIPALSKMSFENGSNASNPRPMTVRDYEEVLRRALS